jgi:hypothetical protein
MPRRKHSEQSAIPVKLRGFSAGGVTVDQLNVSFGNVPFPEGGLMGCHRNFKQTRDGKSFHYLNMGLSHLDF